MSPYFFAGLVFMAALTFSTDAQEKPTAREPAPPIAWHARDHKANATLASEQLWPPWPMGLTAIAFSDAPGLCAISWFKFVEDLPGWVSFQIAAKNLFLGECEF
jgi:hypothetical protein